MRVKINKNIKVIPIRVSHNSSILRAPIITTSETKDKLEAINEAMKYSGLSRFKNWKFLIVDEKLERQIINILLSHNSI